MEGASIIKDQLLPDVKVVEAKVENPVNLSNCSIIQNLNSPTYPNTLIFNLTKSSS